MQHPNLTLRDYLIAHAPAKPQKWFAPVVPPRPEDPADDTPREQWQAIYQAVAEWHSESRKQLCIQWPGAWADAQIALRPADDRAYLFAVTVADADGVHAYVVSKVAESHTEARAAAIAAAIADRGGLGVDPLECELVGRISTFDGEVFIRVGVMA